MEPSCFGASVHSSTQLLVPQVPEFVLSPLPPVPPVASAPPGLQVDLMAQMRYMMEEVLDRKLTAQSYQLSSSFQASLSVVKSGLAAESVERKAEQKKIVERLAALETSNSSQAASAPQNGGNSPQDPCLCVVGGFGTLLRSEVVGKVEAALHDVAGVSSVEAPGNVPNICFCYFLIPRVDERCC